MELKFFCKYCGSKMSAEKEIFGQEIECPVCNKKLTVPFPDSGIETANTWTAKDFTPTIRPPQGEKWETGEQSLTTTEETERQPNPRKKVPTKRSFAQKGAVSGIRKSTVNGYGKQSNSAVVIALVIIILLLTVVGIFIWVNGKASRNEVAEENILPPAMELQQEKITSLPLEVPKVDKIEEDKITTVDNTEDPELGKFEFDIVEEKEIIGSNCGVRKVIYGTFDIEANLHRNKTIKVYYAIPVGSTEKPVPNANNVVFHCPYYPEKGFFKKTHFRWFPEEAGYTFFSILIDSTLKNVCDREKMYYYPESGFHDLVFKIKKILEKKFGLESRNILLTGESSGGIMAKEFVLKYYNKVDAAAYLGGHNNIYLYNPKAKTARTACLIMHTCGDKYQKENRSMPFYIQALRAITAPTWKNKGARFNHHAASKHGWSNIQLFVQGVVELRSKHGGKLPPYKEWPFQQKTTKGKTLYFPSKAFKKAYSLIPHDILNELNENYDLNDMSDKNLKFHKLERKLITKNIYFIPKDKAPKAVVIYIHDPAEDHKKNDATQMDCLYYLMQQGVVGCSVKINDDHKDSLKRIIKLLKEVKSKEEWKELPIYVAGLGIGGEMAAVAALRYGDDIEKKRITKKKGKVTFSKTKIIRHPRVLKILTINSQYKGSSSLTSIAKARTKSKIPMVMLYSKDYYKLIPQHISDYTDMEKINTSGYTLGRKWYQILKKHLVPESSDKDTLVNK